jgi:4-amino-4-deoxy-L-arabinose transferase-like glycosyltransferase
VAAVLRFWQLGQIPPGLYRDEAINGLDALKLITGQSQEESPFYFAGNNGREPLFVYLTTFSVYLFGRSVLAVRLVAAIIGTLTTWFTYKLAKSWFGQEVGLLSAWVWAITIWPIHLSRIGLRPILLPLFLASTFWLATLAYRQEGSGQRFGRSSIWLWFMTGVAYGASFYTYLAVRFTILVIALLIVYLILSKRAKPLWPGILWAALGTTIIIAPLAFLVGQQTELLFARAGQVSILNPDINGGDLLETLWRQGWKSIGLFFIEGDTIVRHNPPGRPVFDLILLVPFMAGLIWCIKHWRNTAAVTVLLWVGIMLGPTLLAEDAPHFLRAVGILPAVVVLPAIGLSLLWKWSRLPSGLGQVLAIGLLVASLAVSLNDYFINYSKQPQTAYLFEDAARDLSEQIISEDENATIYLDRRFWDGWPSIRFLLDSERQVSFYRPNELEGIKISPPSVVYAWPYDGIREVTGAISSPAQVSGQSGSLAKGDLEVVPYPLYVRHEVDQSDTRPVLANFDNSIQLRGAEVQELGAGQLLVDLYWSTESMIEDSLITFVHVSENETRPAGLVGQSDNIPSRGNWPTQWWRPGLIIHDQHIVTLEGSYDENRQEILIGLYKVDSLEQLPLVNDTGASIGDTWLLQP